jgi:hypothetical protein
MISINDRIKNETNCKDCHFYKNDTLRKRKPIIIPCLYPIKLMIVSRDPTIDFLLWYNYSIENYDHEVARKVLFAKAIPYSVLFRIDKYSQEHFENLNWKNNEVADNILFIQKLFENAYWTHFHKCPTGGGKGTNFKKTCANVFLKKEMKWAEKQKIGKILVLGEDIKEWIYLNKINSDNILTLPHPSGANNGKWSSKNEEDAKNISSVINSLLKLSMD